MNAYAHLPYRMGVGIMLLNAQAEVFVAKRIDNLAEAWQMPQGGMDAGEQPEISAYRELEEETSIRREHVSLLCASAVPLHYDLPDALIPKVWGGKFRGQQQHWFAMRLMADESVINIATNEPEFSEYKWVPMAQLPEIIVPFKRDLYQQLLDYFQPIVG